MRPTQSSGRNSQKLLRQYPDIKVEIIIDYGLTDIVAQRFDAGVRGGEQVAKDMIAVRIGPDMRMAVVGAPSYFRKRPEPKKPQDLIGHNCINLRLPTHGGLYAWEFEKGGRELKVRVEGQLVFNGTVQMLNAALAGFGLAYVPEDLAQPHLAKGRLKRVLEDWCPPFPATTSTTRADASPRRPLPSWSTRCATAAETAALFAAPAHSESAPTAFALCSLNSGGTSNVPFCRSCRQRQPRTDRI